MKKGIKKILAHFGYQLVPIQSLSSKRLDTRTTYDVLKGAANTPFNSVPFAAETLEYLVSNYEFDSVLDVGSGEGKHSDVLREVGKQVTSIDFGTSVYYNKRSENQINILGDYYTYEFDEPFDAIWASHVLEHQPNPNLFLKKLHKDLKEGGVLAITVPPLKHEIVGGHVSLWNAGLLLYQLVLAGFNCKEVAIKAYGYNISVVLRKQCIKEYPELSYDSGDIMKMKAFFPNGFGEPFNGDIKQWNWR
ncbi:class I SAM-dependent methyltransferase [Mangrovimonas xylaniphaga]|uniref:class I SAM-dependent methyltransferase n=1 Tax=Mangrovimonas xylaniphaga TaxID=1645915 RepID=UPI0006B5DF7E|nr:class I SAM-dependent methyltransferase [Mangrovimonas xylaniphaga]